MRPEQATAQLVRNKKRRHLIACSATTANLMLDHDLVAPPAFSFVFSVPLCFCGE
jgi:hypothetical protein